MSVRLCLRFSHPTALDGGLGCHYGYCAFIHACSLVATRQPNEEFSLSFLSPPRPPRSLLVLSLPWEISLRGSQRSCYSREYRSLGTAPPLYSLSLHFVFAYFFFLVLQEERGRKSHWIIGFMPVALCILILTMLFYRVDWISYRLVG